MARLASMRFNSSPTRCGLCVVPGGNSPWCLPAHQGEDLSARGKSRASAGHHAGWVIASGCCDLGLLWLGGYSHTCISHTQTWLSLRRREAESHGRDVHVLLPRPSKVNGCTETVSLQGHLLASFLSTRSFGRENNNKRFPVEGFFFWHLMSRCSYLSGTCLLS